MTDVIIKTDFGSIKFSLLPDVAPETVRNFVTLAKNGLYDGTLFHRVIPGFMIQGGDPNTKDPNKKSQWGMGGPGHTIKAEFSSRSHLEGIVSMARATDPDSAGSQFFIVTSDNNTEALGNLLENIQDCKIEFNTGATITIHSTNSEVVLMSILKILNQNNIAIDDLSAIPTNLEEVFLKVVGDSNTSNNQIS